MNDSGATSDQAGSTEADAFTGFSYLTADKAPLYRAIVAVFAEAKAGFLLHLRPAEVLGRLETQGPRVRGGLDAIEAALDQLCHWQVLEAYNDNADVATLADFHRRKLQYQLTASGEAVHESTEQFLSRLSRRITLDAAALGRIHDYLSELSVLAASDPIDAEKAFAVLRQVVTDVDDLTTRAQSFFRWLHEQTESRRSDLDTFLDYKERLIEYLREFVGELLTRGARIAVVLKNMSDQSDRLLKSVAEEETRETYDTADPTGVVIRREALARWRNRWQGLRRWFLDDAAGPAQSRQLQGAARAAIPRVLALAQQQRLRQGNRSDRAADLRELAAWFLEAEDDRAAHRLWRAAFGLAPARHLTVDSNRLEEMDGVPVSADTEWAEAPPVVIDPQLRRSGRQRTASAVRSIVDTSEARLQLKQRLAKEREQEAAIRQELLNLGRRRFSEIGELSPGSFTLLMDLVGAATDAKRPNTTTSTGTSRDGRIQIEVDWTGMSHIAAIGTTDGTMHLSDAAFAVTSIRS
ncbi:MAG: TIGR02677 family protein [Planctomycetaceae bacterium]